MIICNKNEKQFILTYMILKGKIIPLQHILNNLMILKGINLIQSAPTLRFSTLA
jgi:hypothetical protein